MRSLIYYGPGDIRMEDRPMPKAGKKDVVVKVARAGICGSDLTAYLLDGMSVGILRNGQFDHDGQFGHEMVGTVYEAGPEVQGIEVGDRVFINPTVCKRNGMMGCDMAGAFSEYVLVEDAAYGYNLLKLADDVSYDEAVVTEPFAVGTHGKNCIQVQPHEKVVICGAGTIGLCALNAVLADGCQKPVVVDMNTQRLALAKEMGAEVFCSGTDGDLKEFLTARFGGVTDSFGFSKPDVDAYIDCAGAGPILDQIVGMAKKKARIAIVAIYHKRVELNAAGFLSGELTMKGSCGYQLSDVTEAFQNVNSHRTRISRIVTHHFPHEQSVEAFQTAADRTSGAIKVVIDYDA